MKDLVTPEDFIHIYEGFERGDFSSYNELTSGVILTGTGFLEKLYKLAKPLGFDCYMTVDFDERLFEDKEWFDGWSWGE